jgi:hypothetical protein
MGGDEMLFIDNKIWNEFFIMLIIPMKALSMNYFLKW